jgi:hypothetical protein
MTIPTDPGASSRPSLAAGTSPLSSQTLPTALPAARIATALRSSPLLVAVPAAAAAAPSTMQIARTLATPTTIAHGARSARVTPRLTARASAEPTARASAVARVSAGAGGRVSSLAPPPSIWAAAAAAPGPLSGRMSYDGTASVAEARLLTSPSEMELESMPAILLLQLQELESWALANRKDSRRDAVRFWVLKIPAVVVASCAGIFAFFSWEAGAVVASAVASICVLIDGLNPGGALRNAHYQAFYDLRNLQQEMRVQWRIQSWKAKEDDARNELAAHIIEDSKMEISRIAASLRDAESALGARREQGSG